MSLLVHHRPRLPFQALRQLHTTTTSCSTSQPSSSQTIKPTYTKLVTPNSQLYSTSTRKLRTDHARQHHETRLVPFSPSQLYSVVSDVDSYCEFAPWCTSSKITKRIDDSHLIADLSVGFRFLSDNYTSVITLEKDKKVSADVPNSSLFDYLVTDWTFEPYHNDLNKTHLSFYVEFAFRNPLYRRVTDLFFEQVARKMVGAFETQCFRKFNTEHVCRADEQHNHFHHRNNNDTHLSSSASRAGIIHRW